MRNLCLVVTLVLAFPAAALAGGSGGSSSSGSGSSGSGSTTGDGSLAVTKASGTIFVQGHGVIYGHFDSGTLMVLGYRPDDLVSVPAVSSGKSKYSRGSGVYTGTDVRFLLPSGSYTIELIGAGIDAVAVGHGSIVVTGQGTFDDGSFAVNGGRPVLLTRNPSNDSFGVLVTTGTGAGGSTTSGTGASGTAGVSATAGKGQ